MRKEKKQQLKQLITIFHETHEEIKKYLYEKNSSIVCQLLADCQDGAIQIGNTIEVEEKGFSISFIIKLIEQYCETVYHFYNNVQNNIYDMNNLEAIDQLLIKIEAKIEQTIPIHKEIVFLPYKASMWDSLESIWKSASEDPNCRTYVIPIPYYDRNPDMTFSDFHYEGGLFPSYVPITSYTEYNLSERKPDVVYIHNPYDAINMITSISPEYYSDKLCQETNCLVYVPYYVMSGGISIIDRNTSCYHNVNYIVVQSDKYKNAIVESIPREKILPLGSPKIDYSLQIANKNVNLPKEWSTKIKNKKVYFFNTSIEEMLYDTEVFLNKLQYIFNFFEHQPNHCLLWRPHPLLENSFHSMRFQYKAKFLQLKQEFLQKGYGIYDDTSNMEIGFAISDGYLGLSPSSLVTLFSVAGKPIIILNSGITTLPSKNDILLPPLKSTSFTFSTNYLITERDQLYCKDKSNNSYSYLCNLSEYTLGDSYSTVLEYNNNLYICPHTEQNLLIIDKFGNKRMIMFQQMEQATYSFRNVYRWKEYLFFIPNEYPYLIRYHMETENIDYIELDQVITPIKNPYDTWGGSCIWNDFLLLSSPLATTILLIHCKTLEKQLLNTGIKNNSGCFQLIPHNSDIWILPFSNTIVTRWNPLSGDTSEYDLTTKNFVCNHRFPQFPCNEKPFSSIAFTDSKAIFAPWWGNQFIELDLSTGIAQELKVPFEILPHSNNPYYYSTAKYVGSFIQNTEQNILQFFLEDEQKLYNVNLSQNEWTEIPLSFQEDDLYQYEYGYGKLSKLIQYGIYETAIHSLPKIINEEIQGDRFSIEKQIQAYEPIINNLDGTSGMKIHQEIMKKID